MKTNLSILLLFGYSLLLGQAGTKTKILDELLKEINLSMGAKQYNVALDSARKYKNIAMSVNDRDAVLRGFNIMGYCSLFQSKRGITLSYFDSAHVYSNGMENKAILAKIYANRALTLDSLARHNEAMANYEIAAQVALAIRDYQYASNIYKAIAGSYGMKVGIPTKKKTAEDKEKIQQMDFYAQRIWDLNKKYGVNSKLLKYEY